MLARTPAALKKRRYRRRLRDGVIVLNAEVCEHAFAEALLISGCSQRAYFTRGTASRACNDGSSRWRQHLGQRLRAGRHDHLTGAGVVSDIGITASSTAAAAPALRRPSL
jgi:hypothetical protein